MKTRALLSLWIMASLSMWMAFAGLAWSLDQENSQDEVTGKARTTASAIVLDLDGDGIETIGRKAKVLFDHEDDGFAELTGWVSPDDALLVLDRNGDGQIDNGTELFGNNTVLPNGSSAENGFVALKELDSTKDGVIDAQDARWSELWLWQDRNSDGTVDDGELITLENAGINCLKLGYEIVDDIDEHGNTRRQKGSFVHEDGTSGDMMGVWFGTEKVFRKEREKIAVTEDLSHLPDMEGHGIVPDLHQAIARDESGALRAILTQYLECDSVIRRQALVWDVIFVWSGVMDTPKAGFGRYLADARKMRAIEKFLGHPYAHADINAYTEQCYIEGAFDLLAGVVSAQLDFRSHSKDWYAMVRKAVRNAKRNKTRVDVSEPLGELIAVYKKGTFDDYVTIAQLGYQLSIYNDTTTAFHQALMAEIRQNKKIFESEIDYERFVGLFSMVRRYEINPDPDGTLSNNNHELSTILIGGDDGEMLVGDKNNDIFWAGAGNDRIYGGPGNDVYFFCRGDGHDVLSDGDGFDVVRFGGGILPDDIELTASEQSDEPVDWAIRIRGTGDTLTIAKGLNNDSGETSIEQFEFLDGTVWSMKEILGKLQAGIRVSGTQEDASAKKK